jgi:hypothetical protein
MTRIELYTFDHTGRARGLAASQESPRYAESAQPTRSPEVVPVDVRVRTRRGGFLYTRDSVLAEIGQNLSRCGLIMDCYA